MLLFVLLSVELADNRHISNTVMSNTAAPIMHQNFIDFRGILGVEIVLAGSFSRDSSIAGRGLAGDFSSVVEAFSVVATSGCAAISSVFSVSSFSFAVSFNGWSLAGSGSSLTVSSAMVVAVSV